MRFQPILTPRGKTNKIYQLNTYATYIYRPIIIRISKVMASTLLPILTLTLLLWSAHSKIISKTVNLHSLAIIPQTYFLTKFDIGEGSGNITIDFKKMSVGDFEKFSLMFGLLLDDNYKQFRQARTCEQKEALYTQTQPLPVNKFSYNTNKFSIANPEHEHIYYLYLYDCKTDNSKKHLSGVFSMDINMINNGSYFGEDENVLLGYIVIMAIWLVMLMRLFMPVIRSVDEKSVTYQQVFIYSGFIMLGVAELYRLVTLLLVYFTGTEVWYLLWIYKFFKYAMEGILVTVIASIGWGWSLTHFKQEPYYIIAGTVISLINFMAMILETSVNEMEQSHHQYESLMGMALFLIRIIIFLVFVVGILRCMSESVGKRRHFIKKFGYYGGAYLIIWPLTVILVQAFLPNYMHNEVVTLVEQGAHVITTAYMCHLFAFPDTDFKKVRIKDEEDLPVYNPKS